MKNRISSSFSHLFMVGVLCAFTSELFAGAGDLDTSFNLDASVYLGDVNQPAATAIATQADGKIVIGGYSITVNGTRTGIARLHADGSLDSSFNPGSGFDGSVNAMTLQPDGKMLIGGRFFAVNGTIRSYLARLNADGSLDNGFSPTIIADGCCEHAVNAIAIQADGNILVGGRFWPDDNLIRFNADGSRDLDFDVDSIYNGQGAISTIAIQTDGKIFIGGEFSSGEINYISRLNSDGTQDNSFNTGSGANNWVLTSALQPDGKILISGDFTTIDGVQKNNIARLNTDGSLDNTFLNTIIDNTSFSRIAAMVLLANGKIIIGRSFLCGAETLPVKSVMRLNTDGSLDASFNSAINDSVLVADMIVVSAIAVQVDGNIVVSGSYESQAGTGDVYIAKLSAISDGDSDDDGTEDAADAFPNDPAAITDTDGDGKPDSFLLSQFEDFGLPPYDALPGTLPGGWSGTAVMTYHPSPPGPGPDAARAVLWNGKFLQAASGVTGSTISFWYSGPSLQFYIDGVLQAELSSSFWTQYSQAVTPGNHVLRWVNARPTSGIECTYGGSCILVPVIQVQILIDDVDFGNAVSPLVLDLDDDNDGITDLEEYTNGSNPLVAKTKNDYNSDGIAGWIWKGQSNGVETQTQIWQLTWPLQSPNYSAPARTYPPIFADQANWEIATTGDFDKDGDADILWRHLATDDWKIWQMQDGLRVAQSNWRYSFFPSPLWSVVGAGDTDNDGDDDVIFNNTTTGDVWIWEMQDHDLVAEHYVGTKDGYTLNRIGDFNKDGDVDLLFRQNGADALITWEIETNTVVQERTLNSTGAGYNPVCAGDFDGDGDDDIMFVHSSTKQEKWFVMENYTRTQRIGGSNDGFVFLGCGDYDGDGDADSLWQRSANDQNRVVLQQDYGTTKQTVYTNAFGGVNPGAAGYGFQHRANKN